MRIRLAVLLLLFSVAACGGGGDPTVPAGQDGDRGIMSNVDRAQDVANDVNSRESQLEQIVEDMGG